MKLRVFHTVVFQCKGNIFCHSQADELPVGILQHRADMLGDLEQIKLTGLFAAYF